MHIPKEKRIKWDTKSKPHILVGYADNVKGYRIYDPDKKCVSVSRDVIIQENIKTNIVKDDETSGPVGEIFDTQPVRSETDESVDIVVNPEPNENTDQTVMNSVLQNVNETTPTEPTKRIRRAPQRYGFSNSCVSSNQRLKVIH